MHQGTPRYRIEARMIRIGGICSGIGHQGTLRYSVGKGACIPRPPEGSKNSRSPKLGPYSPRAKGYFIGAPFKGSTVLDP